MSCDPHEVCITCGDVGVEMDVVAVAGDGLATCASAQGERREVETALVGDVAPGDVLLVHADVALTTVKRGRRPSSISDRGVGGAAEVTPR